MNKILMNAESRKSQAVRLAGMITASTGITPAGFTYLCRTIIRDSRRTDFKELYGEPPALARPMRTTAVAD